MTKGHSRDILLLILLLAFSLAVMFWVLVRTPLTPNEARSIYMGREVITNGVLSCSGEAPQENNQSIEYLICAYPGSVAVAPLATATMEKFSGLYGGRSVGILFSLALVLLVYLFGNSAFYGGKGLLAATTFVFFGVPLQLSSSAPDAVIAAFFLSGSLCCIGSAAESQPVLDRAFRLLFAAVLFSIAIMTNYYIAVFAVPVVLYIISLRQIQKESVFFFIPLVAILSLYGYVAVLPATPFLVDILQSTLMQSKTALSAKTSYVLQWLALPYVVSAFGLFHGEKGKIVFMHMLFSSPAFLVPFVSSEVGAMHAGVLFSLVFLAPAVAIGVEYMGGLLSSYNPASSVRQLFMAAVLVVIFVFGLQQIKKLSRDYPDLSPAGTFLQEKIGRGTVVVESDYGSPEYVYRYLLEQGAPSARIVPIVRGDSQYRSEVITRLSPDFIVLDDYHCDRSSQRATLEYLAHGFREVKTYQMTLSSDTKNIRIFQKEVL